MEKKFYEFYYNYLTEAAKGEYIVNVPEVIEFTKLRSNPSATKKQLVLSLAKAYHAIEPKMEEVHQKFKEILESLVGKKGLSSSQFKVITNLKTLKSVISKVLHRGKDLRNVGDLVRGSILFKHTEDVDNFVEDFQRKYPSLIVDTESKHKGSDETFGYYGSHHFDLNIDGVITELQVMTKKLYDYKNVAGQIRTAHRDTLGSKGKAKEDEAPSNDPEILKKYKARRQGIISRLGLSTPTQSGVPRSDIARSKRLFSTGNMESKRQKVAAPARDMRRLSAEVTKFSPDIIKEGLDYELMIHCLLNP